MQFVERLQIGCHQATTEAFAKTFDGNKARVGSVEIKVDEAIISVATDCQELVRAGLKPLLLKIWISEFI